MLPHLGNSMNHSAIYKKALEIFALTRQISFYLTPDVSHLQKNGTEDPNIYFTGDIVQQSVSLGPQILKAERQYFSEEKHKYAASVMRLSNLLYKNCERLEQINSNGKDFLPLLRSEIKKFRKLQRNWLLTL
ncbi:hypothetical protein KIV10_08730 [Aequorivita echinoideorum]|uniref:Uncharacterized protein n=2 Tax=Aequorivita echinoideorum TaxID=1549647 RepID=A0ABS5S765_9FLAO|nr:hypothetical protein [Aequorivita echinoideorum]